MVQLSFGIFLWDPTSQKRDAGHPKSRTPRGEAALKVLGLGGQVQIHRIQRFVLVVVAAIAGGQGSGGRNAGGSGDRVALLVDLHAQREAHLREDFLDLVQALAAEVLGLEQLGFGLLRQLADGLDVGVLQAVVAAYRQLQLFHRAVQVVVAQNRAAFLATRLGIDFLLEVDEDVHVVLEQLGGQADGVGGQHGPVGPHFKSQLVIVGDLAQAGGFHHIVDAAHRRVDRVHGNKANAQIGVEVLVGGDIAASALEAHLHVQLAAFGNGGNIDVLVQDLDVAVSLDHAGGDHAGLVGAQIERLRTLARELEGNLLEVQDDVGGILDHAADGLELVEHTL